MTKVTTPTWSNLNEVSTRSEMLKDPKSSHWNSCYAFVLPAVRRAMKRGGLSARFEDDIVQMVMEAVAKNLPFFRGECRMTTWLTKIVASKVLDIERASIRSDSRQVSLDMLGQSEDGTEPFEVMAPRTTEEESLVREKLREALAKLQEFPTLHKHAKRNASILHLALLKDRPCEEVAERLGIDRETVHSVVYQARQYLRENS